MSIENKMENLTDLRYTPLPKDSPYVKPVRLLYKQNGIEKSLDLLKVHDSVAIILFNVTRNVLVFVKQFRPAVYYGILSKAGEDANLANIDLVKFPPKLGITIEMCAGICDKDKSLVEIAQEEINEEVGYDVDASRIEQVMQYISSAKTEGALQTLFYCEVKDEDRLNHGGGVDDEIIEVVECSITEARKMLEGGAVVNSPPSFLFALLWFLENKAPKFEK